MTPEFNVNVFMQQSEYVKQLESERDEALRREAEALRRMNAAEFASRNEMTVNNQLIDLLQRNGIKYRKSADMRTWDKG